MSGVGIHWLKKVVKTIDRGGVILYIGRDRTLQRPNVCVRHGGGNARSVIASPNLIRLLFSPSAAQRLPPSPAAANLGSFFQTVWGS